MSIDDVGSAAIWPQHPSRTPLDWEIELMLDPVRGTEWETCWAYILTHDLTSAEGAAFWQGAILAMQAARNPPVAPVEAPESAEPASGDQLRHSDQQEGRQP